MSLCQQVLEFGILMDLLSSQYFGILMGPNFGLGQYTLPISGGITLHSPTQPQPPPISNQRFILVQMSLLLSKHTVW